MPIFFHLYCHIQQAHIKLLLNTGFKVRFIEVKFKYNKAYSFKAHNSMNFSGLSYVTTTDQDVEYFHHSQMAPGAPL